MQAKGLTMICWHALPALCFAARVFPRFVSRRHVFSQRPLIASFCQDRFGLSHSMEKEVLYLKKDDYGFPWRYLHSTKLYCEIRLAIPLDQISLYVYFRKELLAIFQFCQKEVVVFFFFFLLTKAPERKPALDVQYAVGHWQACVHTLTNLKTTNFLRLNRKFS